MTIKRGTSFTGTAAGNVLPKRPINYVDVDTIAADQGYIYEKLTNRDAADGSTEPPPTNTGHNHSEDGNVIYRCLLSQAFGAEGGQQEDARDATSILQAPYTIAPTSSTTSVEGVGLMPILFVPRGFTNKRIHVFMDCDADPVMTATVYDPTNVLGGGAWAVVPGYDRAPIQLIANASSMIAAGGFMGSAYGFTFETTTAGPYVVRMDVQLSDTQHTRSILSIHALAEVPPMNSAGEPPSWPPEQLPASATVSVGDIDASNAWHPIDSVLTAEDAPLGAALTLLTANNAFLFEKATGLPTPGNPSATISGHTHAGATGSGAEIEHVYGNWCFGSGASSSTTEIYGNNCRAPEPDTSTTREICFIGKIYLPNSSNTAAGTSNLKAFVLFRSGSGKSGTTECRIGVGANNYDYTTTGGAVVDYDLVSTHGGGSTRLVFSDDAQNTITISLRMTVTAGITLTPRLMAVCIVIDP